MSEKPLITMLLQKVNPFAKASQHLGKHRIGSAVYHLLDHHHSVDSPLNPPPLQRILLHMNMRVMISFFSLVIE